MQPELNKKRFGFTLIELLVVIAIIAILAAILFPAFSRARENARRASCQSNLKQIALGIQQYTQDYDERFPVVDAATGFAGNPGWAFATQPYLKSEQIFQCPSDSGVNPVGVDLPTRALSAGFSDYLINYNLGGQSSAVLQYTTNTVMNAEGSGGNANFNAQRQPAAGSARHLEGANYSFADGHVKWYRPEVILPGNIGCNGDVNAPNGSNTTYCTF
ncbi:DUF1559 domain-containing protein [bacterium]|nr:MAG: DUF1559 domain-containing protein [bacterium]